MSKIRQEILKTISICRWFMHHVHQILWVDNFAYGVRAQWSLQSVQLFSTACTVAYQTPLSMRFSRQEYLGGCISFFQGIFLTQGLNLRLLYCLSQIVYHWGTWEAPRYFAYRFLIWFHRALWFRYFYAHGATKIKIQEVGNFKVVISPSCVTGSWTLNLILSDFKTLSPTFIKHFTSIKAMLGVLLHFLRGIYPICLKR